MVGKKVLRDAKMRRIRAYPGQRRLHRLLHHLADLSGHGESPLAFHGIGFDEEHVATRWGPGQTYSHSGALGTFLNLAFGADFDPAQEFLNDFLCDHKFLGLALGQPPRLSAADVSAGALQAAYARLAR